MSAPTDVTRVDPMSIDQIMALPPVFPVWPTASAALGGFTAGLSRPSTYAMAKDGTYPVPILNVRRRRIVRRCDVLAYLGLNDDATGIALPVAPVESSPVPTATQQ